MVIGLQFVDHPEDFCFRLPDNVSYEEGAFCEPLSVGVHACRRGQVAPGKRVAILGSGPIGVPHFFLLISSGRQGLGLGCRFRVSSGGNGEVRRSLVYRLFQG